MHWLPYPKQITQVLMFVRGTVDQVLMFVRGRVDVRAIV